MNYLLTLILDAAPAGNGQQGAGGMSFWIMMILIFAVMWLFLIRPQRKQQKELEKFRNELKKGDRVVTAGGIFGTIAEVQEQTVLIKVDGEVKLRVAKNSIVRDYSEVQAENDQAQQK